ncbi:hypothetical protein GW17_00042224 [Ensete ventricosum]|nr:hypothetical protein GW17_00042224 [Ensete ventricosum]
MCTNLSSRSKGGEKIRERFHQVSDVRLRMLLLGGSRGVLYEVLVGVGCARYGPSDDQVCDPIEMVSSVQYVERVA